VTAVETETAQIGQPEKLNAPFACACGNTRFIELTQWNRLVCKLESDPDTAPCQIMCGSCRRVYQQATDWSWRYVVGSLAETRR
jgi:hypothetical protein